MIQPEEPPGWRLSDAEQRRADLADRLAIKLEIPPGLLAAYSGRVQSPRAGRRYEWRPGGRPDPFGIDVVAMHPCEYMPGVWFCRPLPGHTSVLRALPVVELYETAR